MKKKIEKTKRDQQTVVLEDINSKMSLVLEQFSSLNRKMDNNHKDFLEFKGEMIDFRKKMISEMHDFKQETGKNFDIVKDYLFNIDDEIQSLKSELKEMKKNLGKVDQTEKMEAFEKRLVRLEKLVLAKAR